MNEGVRSHDTSRGQRLVFLRVAASSNLLAQLGTPQVPADLAGLPSLDHGAPQQQIVHALFVSRRGLLPAVRALIDFLTERFEKLDEDWFARGEVHAPCREKPAGRPLDTRLQSE